LSKNLGPRIKEIIAEQGLEFKEKQRTIHTTCPQCGLSDKLSILKENGASICYRGSCQFKGWFDDWLALTAGISKKEASEKIFETRRLTLEETLRIEINLDDNAMPEFTGMDAIEWPLDGALTLDSIEAYEGANYIIRRGIPIVIAMKYGIMYSSRTRRILIPVMRDGVCFGWQGRAIDLVDNKDRMRNNIGFRRDSLVMFLDQLKGSNHGIICEGPFDAMKFNMIGGNIATMGKIVSDKQFKLIADSGIKKLYFAMDDDAADEMNQIRQKVVAIECYKIELPQACAQRCASVGKKADFGECTFEEAAQAFHDAQIFDQTYVLVYLKGANR